MLIGPGDHTCLGYMNIYNYMNKLDKFYTRSEIVDLCVAELTKTIPFKHDFVIEPSAGNGQFLNKLRQICDEVVGIDIQPESDHIIKQDYLTYIPPPTAHPIHIVGNPPFGRVSSLAIKFFNHSAQFADTIAFIVPRTFRRTSVQNKLSLNFKLVADIDIPITPCAFEPPMMAKCCFQIWVKSDVARCIINTPTKHIDWEFVDFGPLDINGQPTPPQSADFAMKAYGGKCGVIECDKVKLMTLRPKSWHWIKSNINVDILMTRFSQLDYSISLNTARQNSIGRGDLVMLYVKNAIDTNSVI